MILMEFELLEILDWLRNVLPNKNYLISEGHKLLASLGKL